MPDSDVTLVAQYDPIEYTIKYDPNLPDVTGMVENQTYVYDTADFKLTEDTFTSTTKDFLGWSLTQDAVTASYPSGAAVDDALKAAMVVSADKTVTMYDAKGNPIQYAAKERPVSGYMTIYKNVAPYESESSFIYDGGTIINRAVTQIAVRKVWKGMDEGEKRSDIKLTLYCKL